MSRIYELVAIAVIGVGFFLAGVFAAELAWTSEIEAARDWERGYRYGYRRCQWYYWRHYGIPMDEDQATKDAAI